MLAVIGKILVILAFNLFSKLLKSFRPAFVDRFDHIKSCTILKAETAKVLQVCIGCQVLSRIFHFYWQDTTSYSYFELVNHLPCDFNFCL